MTHHPSAYFDTMFALAKDCLKNAYAPYSKFHVAACIRSTNNTLFSGVNVENASYGLTTCAEESAIAAMITGGEKNIAELVLVNNHDIYCSPCGACRQRIVEFATEDAIIYLCDGQGIQEVLQASELLPFAFSSDNFTTLSD